VTPGSHAQQASKQWSSGFHFCRPARQHSDELSATITGGGSSPELTSEPDATRSCSPTQESHCGRDRHTASPHRSAPESRRRGQTAYRKHAESQVSRQEARHRGLIRRCGRRIKPLSRLSTEASQIGHPANAQIPQASDALARHISYTARRALSVAQSISGQPCRRRSPWMNASIPHPRRWSKHANLDRR
jgi:hypothetical protein